MKPLDGIKVLDLTRILSGPFCTMTLGDMGAEIIRSRRIPTVTTPEKSPSWRARACISYPSTATKKAS